MSYDNTGKVWTPATLAETLAQTKRPSWIKGITLHHTAAPSLAQRPRGLTAQHLENLRSYYSRDLAWKAGPHFFVDDDQVFGLSPWTEPGTHAKSFNATHLGIEVLGDYDSESPTDGRGLACWQTAAETVFVLCKWIGVDWWHATSWNFHRDDPKTTKTCPGRLVGRAFVRSLIERVADGKVAPVAPTHADLVPVADELRARGVKIDGEMVTTDGVLTVFGCEVEHAIYRDQTTFAPRSEVMAVRVPVSALEVRG